MQTSAACRPLSPISVLTFFVMDASDPTPAEAAGRSAARNDSPVIDAVPHAGADSPIF